MLLLIIVISVVSSAFAALQPWPLKILVDYALSQVPLPVKLLSFLYHFSLSPNPITLIFLAGISSIVILAIKNILSMGLSFIWSSYGQKTVYDLAADLFNRLQRLSLLFHKKRNVGDFLNRIEGDTYCIYSFTDVVLVSPIQQIITLTTIGLVAWNLNKELTVLSLIVAPALVGTPLFFGPRFKRRTRQNREAKSRIMSFVHQTLTAIPLVKAFGTEHRNRREFRRLANELVFLTQRMNILNSASNLINGLTTTTGTALILYIGGRQVLSGDLTLGSLLVFLAYLGTLQASFRNLMETYTRQKSLEASIDRVIEILDSNELIRDAPQSKSVPVLPRGESGHVRFDNVTFGYEPSQPVLKGISLEAYPDETLALVGPTGAGKSTLVSLIPRFFDPWEGRVFVDGIDLREIKLASLRSHISIVLQDPFLLPLSVAENIGYAHPGASLEDIKEAAIAANADEFIQNLPEGYETKIGERGATLSGGQMQRLAIARAFLKNAPILILDEPTSSLDTETETLLLRALDRLMEARTTFIIAHRLSTIRNAKKIVMLENGKITEIGTHSELYASHGAYYNLYSLQSQKSPKRIAI
ncbi:MAG: ABC transporter ATP-binding protein [Thermodesulfobacteriota bacterium]